MELIDAAVLYLNAGLSVIALAGKQPNGQLHEHGLHDAIRGTVETDDDRALLDRVFTHPATTGIGIVIPDFLVVVDIDGEEGAQAYRDLGLDEDALATPAARTGRGLHLWYATTRPRRSTKLRTKLDLKGVGGYVAAPPSRHPDGHLYEWLWPLVEPGLAVGQPHGLQWLPDSVERVLDVRDAIEQENAVEVPVYTQYNLSLHNGVWRLRTERVPPPVDGLARAVAGAEAGNRNNLLAWAVLQARDDGVTLDVALRELGGAAVAAGLSEREANTTIRAAYRRSRT